MHAPRLQGTFTQFASFFLRAKARYYDFFFLFPLAFGIIFVYLQRVSQETRLYYCSIFLPNCDLEKDFIEQIKFVLELRFTAQTSP